MIRKVLFLSCMITSLSAFCIKEPKPIDIIESTLKIAGLTDEVYYYGFAEGDQLIFNFEEVNGKELKEIEISEIPYSSKFMDFKTKKIENKVIHVTKTAIYKFRFSNTAIKGRICKFKIQRIPVSEFTVKFNTTVYWNTIYDSTYTTVKERYLIKQEFKPISVVPVTEYYINSGSNATFLGGKSRITFPVVLPANTQEWYYEFSASRDKADLAKVKSTFNLIGQLASLIDQTQALTFGVEMLTKPPGGNVCDVYQMDYNNSRLFEAKQTYNYYTAGSRENIKSGIIKLTGGAGMTYYLGIKNPDASHGIQVAIEVVAVVLNEEWGIRDVQKLIVTSKEVPFLKD